MPEIKDKEITISKNEAKSVEFHLGGENIITLENGSFYWKGIRIDPNQIYERFCEFLSMNDERVIQQALQRERERIVENLPKASEIRGSSSYYKGEIADEDYGWGRNQVLQEVKDILSK